MSESAFGDVTRGAGPLVKVSRVIDADPEQIWRTLTEPDLVARYFFGTRVETDWKVGSPITYSGEWNGEPYEDRGTVVEVVEPLRLVTTFFSPSSGKADTPENRQTVSYRIQPIDGGCRVTIEQDHNESEDSAEHSTSNWRVILDGLADVAVTV